MRRALSITAPQPLRKSAAAAGLCNHALAVSSVFATRRSPGALVTARVRDSLVLRVVAQKSSLPGNPADERRAR